LTEEQKGRVYIEFLTILQRVKYSTQPQMQVQPSQVQVNTGSILFNYPYPYSNQTLPEFSTLGSSINPHQVETINPTLHSFYSQYNPQTSASTSHSTTILQNSDFENSNK